MSDRDQAPGLRLKGLHAAHLVHFNVEAAAMHSKSQGWIPAVVLTMTLQDGTVTAGIIAVGDELSEILDNIRTASERAVIDVETGVVQDPGAGKEWRKV